MRDRREREREERKRGGEKREREGDDLAERKESEREVQQRVTFKVNEAACCTCEFSVALISLCEYTFVREHSLVIIDE